MSARRRHKGPGHAEAENHERWLLTYADMITLLLALFILLFAMSTISQKKFIAFRMGLTQTFNPSAVSTKGGSGLLQQSSLIARPGTNPSPTPVLAGTSAPTSAETPADRTAALLKVALAKAGLAKDASVTVSDQGAVVQILADQVFFQSDSASFDGVGNRVIDTIAGVVQAQPNNLEVEGFTDNVPVTGGPYTSNWELSAVRAANVVNRMNTADGIPMSRLAAVGYGQAHPQVPNTTAANRAKNRRVDVVVLNS
jgi:chemotaxis protein MotB